MIKGKNIIPIETIQNKILLIRGKKVMLDRDLAELYGVKTKRLNEQVRRNIDRFPEDFMFQLSKAETENWRSQFATSKRENMGIRRCPYAFTEQGVAMLSSVKKCPRRPSAELELGVPSPLPELSSRNFRLLVISGISRNYSTITTSCL